MRNFGSISRLDAKPAPGGDDGKRKPPQSGSDSGKKKRKLSDGTGGDYPSFNGMRNFGQVPERIAPYKNYGPPKHFRFIRRGDFETLPFYRAPHYGLLTPPTPRKSEVTKGQAVALGAGGIALILGALVFMPLVGWPFIIKSFKPELSYGRRVGIGLGISIGLAAVRTVAKSVAGKD